MLFCFLGRACKHPQGSLFGALFSLFSSQNLVLTGEERNRCMLELAGSCAGGRSSQFPAQDVVLSRKPSCPLVPDRRGDGAGELSLQFPAQDVVLSRKPKCRLVPDQVAPWRSYCPCSSDPTKPCFAGPEEASGQRDSRDRSASTMSSRRVCSNERSSTMESRLTRSATEVVRPTDRRNGNLRRAIAIAQTQS